MGEHDDRESWAQIPGTPELWASNMGRIATLKDGGGFNILRPRMNKFEEMYVLFKGELRKTKGARIVASMVLHAFGQPRLGGHAVAYKDGDHGNCRLENLFWFRKGRVPVGDLKERKCLGHHCGGAKFMSTGDGNRLCPVCTKLNSYKGGEMEGVHYPGEIPDAPSSPRRRPARGDP